MACRFDGPFLFLFLFLNSSPPQSVAQSQSLAEFTATSVRLPRFMKNKCIHLVAAHLSNSASIAHTGKGREQSRPALDLGALISQARHTVAQHDTSLPLACLAIRAWGLEALGRQRKLRAKSRLVSLSGQRMSAIGYAVSPGINIANSQLGRHGAHCRLT